MAYQTEPNGNNFDSFMDEKFLLCPICNKEYEAPKVLPCLHSFCFDCLKTSLRESKIKNGQSFLCPVCQLEVFVPPRGVMSMKSNTFILTVQEFLDRKEVPYEQHCEGCDAGAKAKRKCIECNDWLCSQCCVMHARVKVTRDHTLVPARELLAGRHDEHIKNSIESLICSKHGEPLKLFCTEPICQAPICTVCKTTLGHDGHHAIPLDDQAVTESHSIQALMGGLNRSIEANDTRLANLKHEEKITSHVRKKMRKAINQRMEEVIENVVKQIGEYAETLHSQVETMTSNHKREISAEYENCKNQKLCMETAKNFGDSLVKFNRSEELVVMSKEVKTRLSNFQKPEDTTPPTWRQPRLHPPAELGTEILEKLFGKLTFEGEIVKSLLTKSFSAHIEGDSKVCGLCDVCITDEDEIVVVDRDNKKVKIFNRNGKLLKVIGDKQLKGPNRITLLRKSKQILIKDEKYLKLFKWGGEYACNFAGDLRQPVGLTQTSEGEVLITDWMSGSIHGYSETGEKKRSFLCASEAPGYVTCASNGNIIISDWKEHAVKMFTHQGRLLLHYGEHGPAEGQLDHPYGVCTDKYNHIIVADTWNNRVHLVQPNGDLKSILVSKEDNVQWPQGVAITKDGQLVVVEQHGNVKIFQYMA